jgi:hypothetical protein
MADDIFRLERVAAGDLILGFDYTLIAPGDQAIQPLQPQLSAAMVARACSDFEGLRQLLNRKIALSYRFADVAGGRSHRSPSMWPAAIPMIPCACNNKEGRRRDRGGHSFAAVRRGRGVSVYRYRPCSETEDSRPRWS